MQTWSGRRGRERSKKATLRLGNVLVFPLFWVRMLLQSSPGKQSLCFQHRTWSAFHYQSAAAIEIFSVTDRKDELKPKGLLFFFPDVCRKTDQCVVGYDRNINNAGHIRKMQNCRSAFTQGLLFGASNLSLEISCGACVRVCLAKPPVCR